MFRFRLIAMTLAAAAAIAPAAQAGVSANQPASFKGWGTKVWSSKSWGTKVWSAKGWSAPGSTKTWGLPQTGSSGLKAW